MIAGEFLTREQVETVHRNALRILSEAGVEVDHQGVRKRLVGLGGCPDPLGGRVRFPAKLVERLLPAPAARRPPPSPPRLEVFAGIYQSRFLDPHTGQLGPFDELRLEQYVALANSLPRIGWIRLLGLPYSTQEMPAAVLPLAEKLFAWKFGAAPFGSVQSTGLCEPLLDMFACHAAAAGRRTDEVFTAIGYLVSPLKLARPECEQLLFFHERGYRMDIGHLPSQGGSAPVTFAGALTLALAEEIFLYLLQRAFREDAVFQVGEAIMTVDMRTGVPLYGRPELHRACAAFGDIARYYGCPCVVHTGLSDARTPSFEAGAQKATGALTAALTVGKGVIEAGLLGVDEICSPVQMILDHDLAGSLEALFRAPVVNDAECAVDEVLRVEPGNSFLGTDLTAQRCRSEFYLPRTWSNRPLEAWQRAGSKTDADLACEIYAEFERGFVSHSRTSDAEERELRKIITRAANMEAA
ncbi:MAG: trimethylamine methyltransferase family protein [Bryobacteraceae bacterium]|nr:trimethylamine methyltransferase family protein [Bryobacteraceae bacterium]